MRTAEAAAAIAAASGVATLLRVLLEPILDAGQIIYSTYLPVVFLGALWAGWRGGVFAYVVAHLCVWAFLAHPDLPLHAPAPNDVTRGAIFALLCVMMTAIGLRMRLLIADADARERELSRAQARQKLLIEAVSAIMFRASADGEPQEPERGWTEFTGRPWVNAGEMAWNRAIHPEDWKPSRQEWERCRELGLPLRTELRLWNGARSDWSWVNVTLVPIREGEQVVEWLGVVRDVHVRREAQRVQELLLGELDHRVKNLILVIQAIARQTVRGARDLPGFEEVFNHRLDALAAAHGLLTRERWNGARLGDLVKRVLMSFDLDEGGAVRTDGPDVFLQPSTTVALSLALHELATNASKYGALSAGGGTVELTWRIDPVGRFRLTWIESGGPRVKPPTRKGFGTFLIEEALATETGRRVQLDYPPEGLRCEMSFDLGHAEADLAEVAA
ncbi:sensor histidine kinase [Caulobacter sp. 17J80-11]|uniref:sensor histidine kinase n=1 Tax=Caulobacter sp. 17J80-11 TaxID=2763502 RepID=UPI001653AE91|nr:HWE histidine kinase domain-containing protein [Caulobacter sp. 17J80-11]MBC6981640.1 DUF4118 domain-containing protein [Caulobacter sp. 17J80-11]